MAHSSTHHLVIIPSVAVWIEKELLVFDRKFYDGMLQYVGKWPGKVSCIMKSTMAAPPAFGLIRVNQEALPFGCRILREEEPVDSEHVREASMVLASGDAFDQLHIAALCGQVGVKCVYVIEYIPETRYQIASLETNNPLLLLRRSLYLRQQERRRIAAFEASDGLQSNGTPAYDHYNGMKNRLLYFDTRVYRENMIQGSDLERRLGALSQGNPLRLAFSGRLVRMKGADHLVRLALLLKERGMEFTFTIYGAGDLEGEMRAFIERHELGRQVFMPGAVDFYNQLLPEIQENTDLFVCLHRQSDPSCTYLETLACGVPIVGYANRAFSGILERADIGWGVEMNDLEGIAKVILRLDDNRPEIIGKARNSVGFASQHDFETTFSNRIDHLLSIVN